jgi:hypothetical protein
MKKIILPLVGLAVAGVLATGCAPTKSLTEAPTTGSTTTEPSTPAVEASEPGEEPAASEPTALKASDLKVTMKITSKECYGSAGCLLGYKVKVVWAGTPRELDADYDVTYKITGDEDGPVLETFTVYSDGQYDEPYEDMLSTKSSGTKPTIKVVEIEEA